VLALGLTAGLAIAAYAGQRPRSAQVAPAPASGSARQVEMAITADEVHWHPRGHRRGQLVFVNVSPRMAVMTNAPFRDVAVLPASMLRTNWDRMFAANKRFTNVVLHVDLGRKHSLLSIHKLIPFRARLVKGRATGRVLTFNVTPLRHGAHRPDRLPNRHLVLHDPTLLVDPTITDAIQAMWQALVSFFSGDTFNVPPNPTFTSDGGATLNYDNGLEPGHKAVYGGPLGAQITDENEWESVQRQVFEDAGDNFVSGENNGNPFGDITFRAGAYDGLAIFQSPNPYHTIAFFPSGTPGTIENAAIYGVHTDGLAFTGSSVGGLNMRGTVAPQFSAQNSVFQSVDITGAKLGGTLEGPRSSVVNSAFVDVRGDLRADGPDGNPDAFNDKPPAITSTDFESVLFQDSSFAGANIRDTTFQGSSFNNVDFSGATIGGKDPATNDGKFQPTFDNSIMEGVKFDGARLQDVSFAGVDFSGGKVTLDGAHLDNVDFTGATGLQFIDWTKVTVDGHIYGAEQYSHLIGEIGNRDNVRTITFDGEIPKIDTDTGFDIEPRTGFLIDTDTGVRLEKAGPGEGLIPIDPTTNEPMRDPSTGDQLVFEPGGVFNPDTGQEFSVDYDTGRLGE
jgi:uncharacterized protein YjbI with pentapeptide repeats